MALKWRNTYGGEKLVSEKASWPAENGEILAKW